MEFAQSKKEYLHKTGRRPNGDVLVNQIRQSFKPGEVTPEEANEVGYETGMRFTKGRYAFIVATHTDRVHIHNHIIFNSTAINCDRKFRDFWFSGLAQADMLIEVYGHIIDEDRRKNAEMMENAFYNREKLNPQMKEAEGRAITIAIPEGVDAELLMKVLGNPEMTALLTSLAGVYNTLTFYYVSKYRQNINNTEYARESLFKFKTDFLLFY